MTRIKKSYKNHLFSVSITGHAGYAEYGKDIVCSAVSILFYSLYQYVEKKADEGKIDILEAKADEGDVYLVMEIRDESIMPGIDVIMGGYEILAENYKKNVEIV